MTAPGGLLGPAPYAPQPSILDRLAARLFPLGQYQGLLGPEQQQGLGRQGLLGLGANLLQVGGASPANRGTLANIGAALGASQASFPEMAQRALQLQSLNEQIQREHTIQQVAQRHAPKPNEKPEQTYERVAGMVADLAGQPGTEDLVGKLGGVLAALKPTSERADWMLQFGVGADGQPALFRINRLTGEVRPTGLGKPPTGGAGGGSPLAAETQAAAQNALAALDRTDAALKSDSNADILPVGTSIARGASHLPFGIGSALSGITEPLAQSAMTPAQKQYQQGIDQLLHNYASLLPKGSRSLTILQNLRASLTPAAGQTEPEVRASFREAREGLRRTLQALAQGKMPTEPMPGLTPTAATPAAPAAPAFNPKFWTP